MTANLGSLIRKAGDSGTLPAIVQLAAAYQDKPVIGSLSKTANLLHMGNEAVKAYTGGEHTVFSRAADFVEKHRPGFDSVVQTVIGGAHSALDAEKGPVEKIKDALSGLVSGGTSAGEAVAQAAGADAAKGITPGGRA